MLTTGPKFLGFKPGRGLLRAIKICSIASFEREVKPSVECCKILRHVKELYKYERNTS
jgi:hypothetical protein